MSQPGLKRTYSAGCKTAKPMKKGSNTIHTASGTHPIKKEKCDAVEYNSTEQQADTPISEPLQEDQPKSPISEYYDIVERWEVVDDQQKEIKNLCVGCGVDMGHDNPRQYCKKTYCPYEN